MKFLQIIPDYKQNKERKLQQQQKNNSKNENKNIYSNRIAIKEININQRTIHHHTHARTM